MEQNINNTYLIDTDKAWNILRERLEKEKLLTGEPELLPNKKQKMLFYRIAAVAAVCAGIIFTGLYFSQKQDRLQVITQNKENSGTLVATLEDGSTVYLAGNASISYPASFAKNNRKVELNGNALFCVTEDIKRPFVVTVNGITIDVVGTVFAVHSSLNNPFELFVKQGKVNVHSNDNQTDIPVEAGESVRLSANGLNRSGIMNPLVFSRFTDKMCFKDEKLNNIIQAINAVHGFPVLTTEESLCNRILTVTFENNSVEAMTELICMALHLEQINKQDTIYIRSSIK